MITVARPLVITTPKLDILASPIKTPLLINDTIAPGTSEAKIDIITTTTAVSVEANESQSVVQTVPVVTVIKEAMIANVDMEGDEIIADDLSEISDDADEILNRQEVSIFTTLLFILIYLTIFVKSIIPSTKPLTSFSIHLILFA